MSGRGDNHNLFCSIRADVLIRKVKCGQANDASGGSLRLLTKNGNGRPTACDEILPILDVEDSGV
jgi:hypothetical protein